MFAHKDADLGRTDRLCHRISTGTAQPIRQPTRRIPPYHREEVNELLQHMLIRDVIQPSSIPWASLVVLVQKKDESARFCVDYCTVTRKDVYPLS